MKKKNIRACCNQTYGSPSVFTTPTLDLQKKPAFWTVFPKPLFLTLVFVAVISGCDIYNPIIDEWWVGIKPGETIIPITTFTVTFAMNGGTYVDLRDTPLIGATGPIPKQVILTGQKANEPGLVENTSEPFFQGWYNTKNGERWTFEKPVTAADADANGYINLEARWASTGVTVSFKNNLTSIGKSNADTTYYDNPDNLSGDPLPEPLVPGADGIELSEPKDFGLTNGTYQFMGWYKDDNRNAALDPEETTKWNFKTDKATGSSSTDDFTLYARWELVTSGMVTPPGESTPRQVYAIEFEDNVPTSVNPNPPKPQYKIEGDTITKPDAINYPDYVFSGWYTNPSFTGDPWDFGNNTLESNTPSTGADGNGRKIVKLYAKWEPEPYTDPWFDENYGLFTIKDSGKQYIPFQVNTGKYNPGDPDHTDLPGGPYTNSSTNEANAEIVRNLLNDHPGYVARIVGYEDGSGDDFDTKREIGTYWFLDAGDGAIKNPDQLIINTKLPAGYTEDVGPDMKIAPNESEGVVEGDGDEIKVYIYIPY